MSAAAMLDLVTMSIAVATSVGAKAAAACAWFLTLVGVYFGNAVLFLGFPGILVCGLVLGLRIKGMRLVSLTSRIRSGVPAPIFGPAEV